MRYKIGDLVKIKSTDEVCNVIEGKVSTMGQEVYFLDSTEFWEEYPFYVGDIVELSPEDLDNINNQKLLYETEKFLEEQQVAMAMQGLIKEDMQGSNLEKKPRLSLIEPFFIEGMVKVLELGADKYGVDNYKFHNEEQVNARIDSLMRHLLEFRKGNFLDDESGESHLYHIAVNCMILEYHRRK